MFRELSLTAIILISNLRCGPAPQRSASFPPAEKGEIDRCMEKGQPLSGSQLRARVGLSGSACKWSNLRHY